MAGYNRAEFSKLSKDQLLDYIEQQTDQLNRFETRFRDVVSAYRSVLKEKEALETTLKALSTQHQEDDVAQSGEEEGRESRDEGEEKTKEKIGVSEEETQRDNAEESDTADSVATTEGGGASETEDTAKSHNTLSPIPRSINPSPVSIGQLKQQLSTLTTAMATLTEEKAKTKTNFQNDKKSMLSQLDQLTNQLHSEKEAAKEEVTRYHALIGEVQENLRKEQSCRTEDQRTHAEMLKELQNLIAIEREQKNALGLKIISKEADLEKLQRKVTEDRTREYEENLKIMSVELEQVRSRLMAAEKQAQQPPPLLLQLQEDMERMKDSHLKSIEAEQRRANDAENRLRSQAEHEELRVASLETKLSELSKTVGSYDKQKDLDQLAIQRLKERISQLDSENTALTKAHIDRKDAEASEQISVLQEKLSRLKVLLKQATVKINEKATLPSNLEELSVSDYNEILLSQPSHVEYEKELYQLKDEFEKYKMRAQSVLRSRGNKMDSEVTNEEIKKLANENQMLRDELLAAQSCHEEDEEKYLIQTRKLREELRSLHDKGKQELEAMESAYKGKLNEVHLQMHTTRERSLKLLSEKDTELRSIRSELHSLGSQPTTPHLHRNNSTMSLSAGESVSSISEQIFATTENSGQPSTRLSHEDSRDFSGEPNNDMAAATNLSLHLKRSSPDTNSAVQELLDQPSPSPIKFGGGAMGGAMGGVNERRLLHYAQEQQRRKEEANMSRKKMFELEDNIRDLQEREQKHIEQIGFLKEEIRKMQRDRSRETENLEYLKNIIIHYMSADSAGRDQMINPIATVLHFSRDEISMIRRSIVARRWISAKK